MQRTGAVVVAAGKGERFGGDKVFCALGDRPVLAHAVDLFQRSDRVEAIVLVVAPENIARVSELARQRQWAKVISVCAGGRRRQDSVREGLASLGECELVAIHDGARPFVTAKLIEDGFDLATRVGAAVAAVPAKDTVKLVGPDGAVEETLDRARLWLAQTPQVFRYALLAEAYASSNEDVTDEAMLLERRGVKVAVYAGSYENIKITTPEDLEIARCILGRLESR